MIISRTPLRISLAGGGSDLPEYYKKNKYGKVLSIGINRYLYVIIKKQINITDYKYKIRWSKFEQCNKLSEIKHPIVKEVLNFFKINEPLEICTFADVPESSGLGSSSTFAVGLINAVLALKNMQQTKGYIADLACDLEINKLKRKIGKQDHYAASYGGINEITFFDNETVNVEPIYYSKKIIDQLENNFFLIYTKIQRNASDIIKKINYSLQNNILKEMVSQIGLFRKILEGKGSLDNIGKFLDKGWLLKKSLSKNNISNQLIDRVYSVAKKNGALGGKICGAGGGGFLLMYAKKNKHLKIKSALKSYPYFNFKFDLSGTRIIYYDERT
jgi:D-glycero-alpha-D-manno-heptose-7-phosphate kinase